MALELPVTTSRGITISYHRLVTWTFVRPATTRAAGIKGAIHVPEITGTATVQSYVSDEARRQSDSKAARTVTVTLFGLPADPSIADVYACIAADPQFYGAEDII